jgi:hypothetical protein
MASARALFGTAGGGSFQRKRGRHPVAGDTARLRDFDGMARRSSHVV